MSDRSGLSGAILAAGFSRRLGRPKQLLEIDGKPLLQWAIDAALGANLDEVLVVLGETAPAILPKIDLGAARVVLNERAIEGQSASIVKAVQAADADRSGTLLMLGDQPGITTDDLNLVIAAFDGHPDTIAMFSWQGNPRSPVVFGRAYDKELAALNGDNGARPLIRRHWSQVRLIEIDRPVPLDIDTEEDYQRLLSTGRSAE
jgi:molybdenum cofactor cytidylyltransferase